MGGIFFNKGFLGKINKGIVFINKRIRNDEEEPFKKSSSQVLINRVFFSENYKM